MEAHAAVHATSTHEASKVAAHLASKPSSSDAKRQKGVCAFVYAMMSVMNSMAQANKGNAAELNAQSAEAQTIAKEYKTNETATSVAQLQNEGGLQAELIQQETIETRANITQQKMGNYSTNIANTEQGILTASLNAKTLIDAYSRMGRTR